MVNKNLPYAIIISGPTASGKTGLADKLALKFPDKIEIINADVGQFYKPFSIGTAKPLWQASKIKHHLFDIIDKPIDLSVVKYRELVLNKINEIFNRGKIPLIVGGSLFYLKSLYFPPTTFFDSTLIGESRLNIFKDKNLTPWEKLNTIDPVRAKKLHPNDIYRIERALSIWKQTGVKPSQLNPNYYPNFDSSFIYISLDRAILYANIEKRTEEMIYKLGWIDEVEKLIGTSWEKFIEKKGFIGYQEIIEWIKAGKRKKLIPELLNEIIAKTKKYAKKQEVFWNSFKKQLEKDSLNSDFLCQIIQIDNLKEDVILSLQKQFNKIIKVFVAGKPS